MNKKKILLLSDDLRSTSGIATMSREFVLGTVDKFDWFQVGAMFNHPDNMKIVDLSEDVRRLTNVGDANVRIFGHNDYGNINLLRDLLKFEKFDAILHFTDPHYWQWLYDNEHELRQKLPILFYHVWDNLPDPEYNRDYYESCDWIGCISKQTFGIVHRVGKLNKSITFKPLTDSQISYVPHGINPNIFKPVEISEETRKIIYRDNVDYDFILFFNNRNIRRKKPADVIYAYKNFCDQLPKESAKKCLLLFNTIPVDDNGTDLIAVKNTLCPDYDVQIITSRLSNEILNELYNLADCTINISNNEGFGLTTAESIMAGTPIIVNVTGGLQDQCGFKFNDEEFNEHHYVKLGSLHEKKNWDFLSHGEWVLPIWSVSQTLNGSPLTPYIFDDNLNLDDVSDAILKMYNLGKKKRKEIGLKGREWALKTLSSEIMCNKMSEGILNAINNFQKKDKYEIYKII
jgi:glycosyltransferase involved in cell wall biosynthesis